MSEFGSKSRKMRDTVPVYIDSFGNYVNFEPTIVKQVRNVEDKLFIILDYTDWLEDAKEAMKWTAFAEGAEANLEVREEYFKLNIDLKNYDLKRNGIPDAVLANFYNDIEMAVGNEVEYYVTSDPDKLWKDHEIDRGDVCLKLKLEFTHLDLKENLGQLEIRVGQAITENSGNVFLGQELSSKRILWSREYFIENYAKHLLNSARSRQDETS